MERAARFCYVVVRGSGRETASYEPIANFDLSRRLVEGETGLWGGGLGGYGEIPSCNEKEGGAGPLLDL